ncbi:MAG: hypothetical protein OXH46_15430 [Gemmatimonadetes bacterium]|nr:hypothetical protein [Gemmatimonadota bacterium]
MTSGGRRRFAPAASATPFIGLPLLLAAIALGGCSEIFDDPTPENIYFEMRGEAGDRVRAIYSTQFVAGRNEFGVTRVQVVRSDTVIHEIPFRRAMDISIDRRWFVQAESLGGDTLSVQVIVNVDDRGLVNEAGGIFPGEPWHFVYAFNQLLTRDLDVEF